MGLPFSHEVQKASAHIDSTVPYVKFALVAVVLASIIVPILIGTLLVAVLALLITVNPDLIAERQRLVTPVLKAWFKVPVMLVGNPSLTGDDEKPESLTGILEKRTNVEDRGLHLQSQRRASPK